MSGEEIRAREEFGALSGCFVEGDPEQQRRQRRVKRRALAFSVSLQIVALAAVILLPLLSKAERISPPSWVPIPPYRPIGERIMRRVPGPASHDRFIDIYMHPPSPTAPVRRASTGDGPSDPIEPGFLQPGPGGPPCAGSCIDIGVRTSAPTQPTVLPPPPKRIVLTHLEPAMLIHRVEPIYPPLAKQIRKEGHVELRAIIGTDGTIQSLQVVSGDVFFLQSAIDAVRQWRYRATVLNGQTVEVDTTISVIYTLAH